MSKAAKARRRQHEGENLGNDRRWRRASYERDTVVAGVPQEVQAGAPEPNGVPQFMQ